MVFALNALRIDSWPRAVSNGLREERGYEAATESGDKLTDPVKWSSKPTTPEDILKLELQDAKQRLVALARGFRDECKSAWDVKIMKIVMSFYRHHGTDLKLQRIMFVKKRVMVELIPSKKQVYKMTDLAGSLRDRAIVLCLWQSGVRIGCLGRWAFSLVNNFQGRR